MNFKENPRISVSFMDTDGLQAYRLNGTAKLIKMATDRVIDAVRTGKKHNYYEVKMTEKFIVLKIKIESIVKIGRRGDIWKETG